LPDSASNDPHSVTAIVLAVISPQNNTWEEMRVCTLQQIKVSWEEFDDPINDKNQIAWLWQISKDAAFAFNLEPDLVNKFCAVYLLIFAHYHEVAMDFSPPDLGRQETSSATSFGTVLLGVHDARARKGCQDRRESWNVVASLPWQLEKRKAIARLCCVE
jgi:hypothetical protein